MPLVIIHSVDFRIIYSVDFRSRLAPISRTQALDSAGRSRLSDSALLDTSL
jgi:hypothetical protein